MMTQTQKKIFEIPILILMIWLWQVLEIWILRLPFHGGALQLVPVLVTYVALTRTWGMLSIICFALAFIGSFNIGYPKGIFIAASLWMALVTKLFSSEFAIEGRRPFTLLVGGAHVLSKVFLWLLLSSTNRTPALTYFIESSVISTLATMALAYLIFPFLVSWDEYFEHPIAESRDLNPDVLR